MENLYAYALFVYSRRKRIKCLGAEQQKFNVLRKSRLPLVMIFIHLLMAQHFQ